MVPTPLVRLQRESRAPVTTAHPSPAPGPQRLLLRRRTQGSSQELLILAGAWDVWVEAGASDSSGKEEGAQTQTRRTHTHTQTQRTAHARTHLHTHTTHTHDTHSRPYTHPCTHTHIHIHSIYHTHSRPYTCPHTHHTPTPTTYINIHTTHIHTHTTHYTLTSMHTACTTHMPHRNTPHLNT